MTKDTQQHAASEISDLLLIHRTGMSPYGEMMVRQRIDAALAPALAAMKAYLRGHHADCACKQPRGSRTGATPKCTCGYDAFAREVARLEAKGEVTT